MGGEEDEVETLKQDNREAVNLHHQVASGNCK